MGIMKGALTLRRYRVVGEVPEGFRGAYQDALSDHAFREPTSALHAEETIGWCLAQNLLETDFSDINRWLYNHYLMAGFRLDKKVVPSKLFRAHRDLRIREWCQEHGRDRAPSGVRAEIEDALLTEMLHQTLPRVQVVEWVWNVVDHWVLFHSTSNATNDRFRTHFRNTFGLNLEPFSPLEFLAESEGLAGQLEVQGISDYRPGTR